MSTPYQKLDVFESSNLLGQREESVVAEIERVQLHRAHLCWDLLKKIAATHTQRKHTHQQKIFTLAYTKITPQREFLIR